MHDDDQRTHIRKLGALIVSRLDSQSSLLSLADIVRELIYNSVDASAKNIVVSIDLASPAIFILDDGMGIPPHDFSYIAELHYTSRDQSFKFFGLKGNALHHVNASLDLYIESKVSGSPSHCWGDLPGACIPRSMSISKLGTLVAVTNALGKFPVRQAQALNTPSHKHIEQIRRVVFSSACLRPGVGLCVHVNDTVLNIQIPPGLDHSNERYCLLMRSIFGSTILSRYETIHSSHHGRSLVGLIGLTGAATAKYQFLLINGHLHTFSVEQLAEISRLFSRSRFGDAHNKHPVFLASVVPNSSMDRFSRFDTQEEWPIVWKMLIACLEGYLSSEGYILERSPIKSPTKSTAKSPTKSPNILQYSSPRKLRDSSPRVDTWDTQVQRSSFAGVRVIGQFDRKFILVLITNNGKDYLCIADQHACDERVKVEALYRTFVEQVLDPAFNLRLRLDTPIRFSLLPHEALLYDYYHDSMTLLGFDYAVKNDTVLLTHLPLDLIRLSHRVSASVFGNRLTVHMHDLHAHRKSASWNPHTTDWFQMVAHIPRIILDALNSQACKSALKFGTAILHEQMSALVDAWKKCRAPHACAHGRPCMIPIREL